MLTSVREAQLKIAVKIKKSVERMQILKTTTHQMVRTIDCSVKKFI